ncbi:MAG: nuclear transport factor 2 family protein [Novosphingobium sp.]|nr:nuclear transport factor 2 family protein [Novosphingobium sp.]
MEPAARLAAIEDIKVLKANYFLGVDTQDWDLLRQGVFIPETIFDLPENGPEPINGAETILKFFSAALEGKVTVHHGHMPIIEVTSDATATGLWAMEDRVHATPDNPLGDATYLHGFGHYHENYVKTDAGWRIARFKLTRIRVETTRVA